jgi:hypothetical protein
MVWLGVLGLAGMLVMPAWAEDQALQAVLQKAGCVPSRVVTTDLALKVAAYEVTCKGRREAIRVLCQGEDCRLQPRPRDEDDG